RPLGRAAPRPLRARDRRDHQGGREGAPPRRAAPLTHRARLRRARLEVGRGGPGTVNKLMRATSVLAALAVWSVAGCNGAGSSSGKASSASTAATTPPAASAPAAPPATPGTTLPPSLAPIVSSWSRTASSVAAAASAAPASPALPASPAMPASAPSGAVAPSTSTTVVLSGTIPPDPTTSFSGLLFLVGQRMVPGSTIEVDFGGSPVAYLPGVFFSSAVMGVDTVFLAAGDYTFTAIVPDGSTSSPLT